MRIRLTDKDLSEAAKIAQERNGDKPINPLADPNDPNGFHYIGILGEMAVAKHFQISINREQSPKGDKYTRQGHDLVLSSGDTVEVKTRSQRGNDFVLNSSNLNDLISEYIILAYTTSDPHVVELLGWSTRDIFLENHRMGDFKGRKKPYLEVKFFKSMNSFPVKEVSTYEESELSIRMS